VLYLKATLPPSEEPRFPEAVGVSKREMFASRDRMVRPNITYAAVGYERKEVDEAVRWLVEENSHRHLEPGQVVVYCRKVEWAKRSAAALGCSVHHCAAGEQQEKKGVLRMLARQAERGFTATNASGVGIST
jgi:superfamily II DNA helicase RecQ